MDTDNIIIIKGGSEKKLQKALNQWLELNVLKLRDKVTFEIAKQNNTLVIQVKRIDTTDFFSLVCFLGYLRAEGYTTVKWHLRKGLRNKKVYIAKNQITTEDNINYQIDAWTKHIRKIDSDREYKALDVSVIPVKSEQIVIRKNEAVKKATAKEKEFDRRGVEKRFTIISAILFIGISVLFFISRNASDFDKEATIWISGVAILLWFVGDYKIFRYSGKTLVCLLLSLLFFAFNADATHHTLVMATLPFTTAVIMWSLNKLLGIRFYPIDFDYWAFQLVGLAIVAVAIVLSVYIFLPIMRLLGIV